MTDFRTLYERHAGQVFRFAYSLSGDRARAEDITSETFVRVWTARDRVDVATVAGYLITIARHLYLAEIRHGQRAVPLIDEPASGTPGPHERAEHRAALAAVLADLQTLAEPDRAAVLMRATDQMPYEDIAAALGISVGAAKVKVHRARRRLAERRLAREKGPS